jgi:hypothetical protein
MEGKKICDYWLPAENEAHIWERHGMETRFREVRFVFRDTIFLFAGGGMEFNGNVH